MIAKLEERSVQNNSQIHHKQLERQLPMNQQQQNHRVSAKKAEGTGGVNVLYWYQIIAPHSVVVKHKIVQLAWGLSETFAMYHLRGTIQSN